MKKMLKTVLAVAMVAVMALSFAGCGENADTTKVIMATNAEFPPF